MKCIFLDVFLNDRFVCTLKYKLLACFKLRAEDLRAYVEEKRPSLIGEPYNIVFDI